ncbi:MAG: helix-turn-helix transcriptional regulator [Desulfofustis sp.]|jgi:transcriptional regulator with XRE-family HTH domain|nr:helix-turn-helix transcriptional regulator [Desulfofustis sp.]
MPRLTDIEERFADALKKECDIRGHGTQTELARRLGTNISRINGIITKYRGSTEDLRRQICEALEVDYDSFVGVNQEARGTAVAQVAGDGNAVSIKGGDELSDLERRVIDGIRQYGNRAMLEGILQKIEEMKEISKI